MSIPVYLLAAYAVFWALTFVLVFSIWARQRRLERELEALEARLGAGEQDAE
jgi:CcmD family protein